MRRIPFRVLSSAAEAHLRYLEEDPELKPFLGMRPRSAGELLATAPVRARRLVAAEALAQSALEYAERHDAPAASRHAAATLAQSDTCAVVTGQQPGLFGGPLYTIHKVATMIRLARELEAQAGGPRVVPVFWNHTDDHDLDEVNRAFVVNANLDLQRVRLDLPHTGAPVRDIPVARAMDQALASLDDLLPKTEFRDWALEALQPQQPDDGFGTIMTQLLYRCFKDDGLVIIEPRDLPQQAFDVLPRWAESSNLIRDVVRSSTEHLLDVGLDVTVDPTSTLMFQITGGRRVPLAEGDAMPRPTALSPGVLLRPLWQDACLPTIATVVGPGELSYLAIAGPLYRQLGVPAPVFVPRASLTLVEPSLKKLLNRFGWDLDDLAQGPERLAESLNEDADHPIEASLEELTESIKQRMSELANQARKVDPQMAAPLERARAKVIDELRKLSGRVQRARQNREGTGLRQVRRLCSHLRPRSRLQERVLTPIPFLVAHGEGLSEAIIGAADPFALEHGVIEL